MRKLVVVPLLILVSVKVWSQTATLSGFIYDSETAEALIGATIYDSLNAKGAVSNNYGFYSLTLENGTHHISVSYIGYSFLSQDITTSNDTIIDFKLVPDIEDLDEVVITANPGLGVNPINTNLFNVVTLSSASLQEYPLIFGESDVIKAIQLQPGVSSLGEGSSGFYVQGGSADQNLMLIDEAPIYNASHLFGLVSVFNPDAIKYVSFYKNPIPAEYGGKISSVVDAQMNDGNKHGVNLSGGIGTLTAHVAVEGPIKKDKASYLIALRRSTRDLLQISSSQYNVKFYDLNAKINWRINPNNRLFFSVYNGRDNLTDDDFINTWGNTTAVMRWNHIFSPKLFANLSVVYSDYDNDREYTEPGKNYHWLTGVKDITGKFKFSWFLNANNEVKYGVISTYHQFIPGENHLATSSLPRVNALESAVYISHNIKLTLWLGLNYGFRATLFQNMQEGQWYEYENYVPTELMQNERGVYSTYSAFEPRITVNLKPGENSVFKLGYAKTTQFSQVIQNTAFSYSALQTWLPAGPNFKPLYANIFSAAYYGGKGSMSYSIEGYYKNINNVIDYVDHAQLINNPFIETQVRVGDGMAYGVTAELKRETEKLKLSIAYTYSRVFNKIPGINNGESYSALQDIPNDLRISVYYKPIKRLGISGYWTFHTGYATTFPTGYVNSNELNPIPIYGARNDSRMPNYHRLDLAVNLLPKHNHKRWASTWSAGVYNAYGRLNPMGIEFNKNALPNARTYTLYRFVPYISYNFKFK